MTILLQGAGIQAVVSAPAGPQFSSAEIGAVNASTLVVTFDQDVTADENDYGSGVTIKVNGVSTSISGGIRQANHAVVYYGIPVLWHGSGDVVTWEYNSAVGIIVAESGGAALGNVSAQSVTNNCEYAALLDLQADTLVLNDGDPVSTWADSSGNGRDFTQTGTARPLKQTVSGYPTVVFDGADDWMEGENFADNLSSFAVVAIGQYDDNNQGTGTYFLSKLASASSTGWYAVSYPASHYQFAVNDGTNYLYILDNHSSEFPASSFAVMTFEMASSSVAYIYINGDKTQNDDQSLPPVSSFSNSATVRLVATGDFVNDGVWSGRLSAVCIYSPAPSATNRAALETRLGARYGLTVP